MNRVILKGNLTRDPELKYSTGEKQTAVCRFTIAVNEGYGDRQRTSYPSIVAFGKTAENCDKFLSKGKAVLLEGRLQTGSYTNKDNVKVYTTDVIADSVEFLSSGNGQQQGGGTSQQPQQQAPAPQGEQVEGFTPVADDDIPF